MAAHRNPPPPKYRYRKPRNVADNPMIAQIGILPTNSRTGRATRIGSSLRPTASAETTASQSDSTDAGIENPNRTIFSRDNTSTIADAAPIAAHQVNAASRAEPCRRGSTAGKVRRRARCTAPIAIAPTTTCSAPTARSVH